jgi:hypothetical protein
MRDAFLKRLFSKIGCGSCGQKYDVADVTAIGHQDDLWFLSAFCRACETQGLVVVAVEDGKCSDAITDLTEADRERFEQCEAVGVDDVLDMCSFLKEFDGDFAALFSGDQ